MKKQLILVLMLLVFILTIPATGIIADDDNPHSDPISKGIVNNVANIYWGKNEAFPVMGIAYPGHEFDVYEYNQEWVLILYDTYLTQGLSGTSHAFFGYIKRSEITCTPALEGDSSPKADTGLGKKKGKKPPTPKKEKENPSDKPEKPSDKPDPTEEKPDPSEETPIEVSTTDDFDWILRTPGLCTITVPVEQANFTCSFSIIAQKAGGIGPSSDPGFNHGIRTPYAATAFFSMISPMQDILTNSGASQVMSGSGGVEIIGQAAGNTFYIDTASLDPALINFTLNLNATATLDPKVTDGNSTASLNVAVAQNFPLPVQLKKKGNAYQFILKGMKPGGGDLEFPAILEKTFSDEDRWEKAARDADKKRKEAERLRKKILELLKKQLQDEWSKTPYTGRETLVSDPLPELAPLDPLPELAPLDPLPELAPLWPITDEAVSDFPESKQP